MFMNIILTAINAKYIHSNLAVYSLRAFAKPYLEEVKIAEYTINQTTDFIKEGEERGAGEKPDPAPQDLQSRQHRHTAFPPGRLARARKIRQDSTY